MCNTLYEKECDECEKKHSLFTQNDNNPEYYTHIEIVCECGNKVFFKLPVN